MNPLIDKKKRRLELNQQYKLRNPEKIKLFAKKYRETHKTEQREYRKYYYEMFPNKQRDHGRHVREKLRDQIFDIIGRECIRCGYSDIRALQFDHINGDGYKETKNNKGVLGKTLRSLRDNPELCKQKLQPLCANCNQIKRFNKNENLRRGFKL